MTTNQHLQDELLTINSSIQRELEAEKRGSTRFSRLPGLYDEKSRIERQLAKRIVDGNIGHDVIAIARPVREDWQRAQGAVPDGYALVPVEPTPAMRVIGARDCSSLIQPDQAGEVWRAMLGAVVVPAEYAFAAAPAHPAERQEQGEVQRLREALEFYARGDHLILFDSDEWDTCSGEPLNWLHDNAGTASVEDGSLAKGALAASTGQEVEK